MTAALTPCTCPTCARLRARFPADGDQLAAFRGPTAIPTAAGPSSKRLENR